MFLPFFSNLGNTPLHLAVTLGHKDCIKVLIEQDAPIKIKNAQG